MAAAGYTGPAAGPGGCGWHSLSRVAIHGIEDNWLSTHTALPTRL